MEVGGQRHAPSALPTGKRPGTDCREGWIYSRAGLDGCGKSRPTGIRSPDRPVRKESLHRLRYPGEWMCLLQLSYSCKRRKNFTTTLQMAQLSFGEVFVFLKPNFEQSTYLYLHPVKAAVRLQPKAHGDLLCVFIRVLTSSQSLFFLYFLSKEQGRENLSKQH